MIRTRKRTRTENIFWLGTAFLLLLMAVAMILTAVMADIPDPGPMMAMTSSGLEAGAELEPTVTPTPEPAPVLENAGFYIEKWHDHKANVGCTVGLGRKGSDPKGKPVYIPLDFRVVYAEGKVSWQLSDGYYLLDLDCPGLIPHIASSQVSFRVDSYGLVHVRHYGRENCQLDRPIVLSVVHSSSQEDDPSMAPSTIEACATFNLPIPYGSIRSPSDSTLSYTPWLTSQGVFL